MKERTIESILLCKMGVDRPIKICSQRGSVASRKSIGIAVLASFLVFLGSISANMVQEVSATDVSTPPIVIDQPGTYVLTTDILDCSETVCVRITSSDVTFDGQGHTIDGLDTYGTYGVYVNDPSTTLTNVTVKNLEVTDWQFGICYEWIRDGTIANNTANSNRGGIDLEESTYNTLINNTANSNMVGIHLYYSSHNTLTNNNISSNGGMGIWIRYSDYNTLASNTANSNGRGIYISHSDHNTVASNTAISNWEEGILNEYSSNNTLTNNSLSSSVHHGILNRDSSNNTLTNNSLSSNYVGILNEYSSDNKVYHNNLIGNAHQAYSIGSTNIWDDGYPSGGNYWGDYAGVDEYSGASQDQPASDGIGDTTYVINADNTDHYPFMNSSGWEDSDGDGLTNIQESLGWDITIYDCQGNPIDSYHVTSDPYQADEDADGLNDLQEKMGWDVTYEAQNPTPPPTSLTIEYHVASNPRSADWDNDGASDSEENASGTDPNKYNTDCDGAWDTNDGFEIEYGLNPLDFDTDDDGIKDGLEIDLWIEAAGYDPTQPELVPPEVLLSAVTKTNDPMIPAFIDIDPDVLNLKSNGEFVTCYIELPDGYDVNDTDVASIQLTVAEGVFSVDPEAPTSIGDHDGDGILDLMVKFDRAAIVDWLGVVDYDDDTGNSTQVEFSVTGDLADGKPFEGFDMVSVISPGK